MPTCGKPAAMTALPQPPKVNQNVPMASATSFLNSISPSFQKCISRSSPSKSISTTLPLKSH